LYLVNQESTKSDSIKIIYSNSSSGGGTGLTPPEGTVDCHPCVVPAIVFGCQEYVGDVCGALIVALVNE
jgi:hypothetical protein